MPKRRVSRTAAQKAASRRNLVKAREARRPSGKIVSGYHLTEPENVGSILRNGFGKNLSSSKGFTNPVWMFQEPPSAATKKRYAMGAPKLDTVKVRIPYRKARKLGRVEAWYIAEAKDVKSVSRYTGRKVRK